MSAAQAIGTPAAASPAPAAAEAPVTAGTHGLDAVLGDLSDVGPIEGDDNGEGALEALTKGPENEPDAAADNEEPGEKPQPNLDELLFSEEALSTKEGVLKAKGRLKELQRKQYESYLGLKKYDQRVKGRAEKLRASVEAFKGDKMLVRNVQSLLHTIQNGEPDARIAAFGHLNNMDGLKAFEMFTTQLVSGGKRAPIDPHVQQILDAQKAEIEQLKQGLSQRAAREETQQLESKLSQKKQELQQSILSSQDTPHLTRIMRDDPDNTIDFITEELREAHLRGERLDLRSYFANLEGRLAPHFQSQAPKGDIGTSPAPKLAQAQSSPGRSVGPSKAAAASTPRVPTEDESLRALADDPALMSLLGF